MNKQDDDAPHPLLPKGEEKNQAKQSHVWQTNYFHYIYPIMKCFDANNF